MTTADKMPLMLDGAAMQVDLLEGDDLFGEGVGLGLPVRQPSKLLLQRMDELRRNGCCQRVAWSRAGTIASISADGTTVEFRFLRCNPDDGSWALSQPTTCELFAATPAIPIVHLTWAATASPELAVIDAAGRVAILTFSIALNKPFIARRWDADSSDDLHAVVGCYWLQLMPQNRQYNVFHGPAVKDPKQPGYRYESLFLHAFGPWHPNPAKSALLCVTDNGVLKLFWSQNNNKIEETTLELDNVSTADDLITHASICSDKNVLFVGLATSSKQLKVLKVAIQWGLPQSDKQLPPGSHPLNPVMKEKHIATTSWLQSDSTDSPLDASMAHLTHLEILPSTLDSTSAAWTPPVALTVRQCVPTPASPYHEVQSIIDRWEITNEQAQSMHPAFEQLGNRRNSLGATPSAPMARLRKLDSIIINKAIVGLNVIQFGKVICLAFSDGTVEYRDRSTMAEIYNDTSLEKIMSLSQIGFTFAEELPCLQVAFSPTNCSVARISDNGKIKWSSMHYALGEVGNSNQDPQYAAIIAGLTVTASAAIFYHVNYDDILALARPYAQKPRFTFDWTNEIVRMLKIPVNYSEDSHHDSLVRNTSLQLCLGILNHLGFRGDGEPRSFGSKFAMLALNARNVVILITIASNTPINIREKLSPLDENEVVDALSGCAKWSLDLLSWLSNCLFALMHDKKFTDLLVPARYNEMTKYLQERNDVSLHLLLCSSTRGFLQAVCRRLLHLEALSNRAIEFYERRYALRNTADPDTQVKIPHALHKAYLKMQHVTSSSLVKVSEFDKLLTALGADIRNAYQVSLPNIVAQSAAGAGQPPPTGKQLDAAIKSAQIQCELSMFLAGHPPPAFLPVISKLFKQDLKAYRATTDPSELFFADFRLLEVEDDKRSLTERKASGRHVDVFKRVELIEPQEVEMPHPSATAGDHGTENHGGASIGNGASGGNNTGAGAAGSGNPMPPGSVWRRCTRCASVMEDVFGTRPGFTFVLAQQRKCACGGHWGIMSAGSGGL